MIFFLLDTEVPTIEEAFKRFTERSDVAILLINQHVSIYTVALYELMIIPSGC